MRLLNKKFARKTAAAALVLATAATLATGAFAAENDGVVAGYMPPQEVMVQGDIALHSADVAVGEVDPNYGGYAAPEGNPIQGNIMLISAGDLDTPLPSDTQVEKAQAHYTVKGLLGKQVLYTAGQCADAGLSRECGHVPRHHPGHADPDEQWCEHRGAADQQDLHHPQPDPAVRWLQRQ
jgi:hypothetical protein